ncbi:hypothetical protein ABEB36_003103 [Hypothenemus hampei]|uniref:AAA+ ATPase domain-containing protein n=1 Tax=Hypothenemus hampei TaxID=57062 RepID=A0ABD1F817_HYPHA
MDQTFSFGVEFCDVLEKIQLTIQSFENISRMILNVIEKLEECLKTIRNGTPTTMSSTKQQENSLKLHCLQQPIVKGFMDIAGLTSVKYSLYTMVILPRLQPQLFANRTVSNTVLLFGPPGTGKTRLVHGLAAESNAALHVVTAADLLSRYVGETEKKISLMFERLQQNEKFSILFIDEVDSLCRKRSSSESDFIRSVKTEFMCQMTRVEHCRNFIIIAATNCPWDLDSAILRRFQKRLYVPLPNWEERIQLFQLLTKNIEIVPFEANELEDLIKQCDGFSGSDISCLIQEALDIPLTELHDTNIWIKTKEGFYEPVMEEFPDDYGSFITTNIIISCLNDLPPYTVKSRRITIEDFQQAVKRTQITVNAEDIKKYNVFIQRK